MHEILILPEAATALASLGKCFLVIGTIFVTLRANIFTTQEGFRCLDFNLIT